MIKIIFHDDNEALVKAAGQMFTLIETERHIKQASSSAVSEKLIRENLPDKDHYGVHLIAMGADEQYGPNKNFDGWPEKMLKRDHPTFVSHGNLYREHKNHHPRHAIGMIKASVYNEPMHRVELIVHGNKKKSEREYESIKAGKARSYSMSARVPFDSCSCCGNRAKSSALYCPHLKNQMGQYLPQFKKFAYAVNPEGKFFDISDVENPADRIAHYLEYRFSDELDKAASANPLPFYSDEMAREAGLYELGCSSEINQAWLEKLAGVEHHIGEVLDGKPDMFIKQAALYAFDPASITEQDIVDLRSIDPDIALYGMAKRGAVLPFLPFCAYSLGMTLDEAGRDEDIKQARAFLPTLFLDIGSQPAQAEIESLFAVENVKLANRRESEILDRISDKLSVTNYQGRVMGNVSQMGLNPPRPCTKQASISAPVERARKLAQTYGLYKVAFCAASERFSENKVIDDAALTLVAFQHLI